MGSGKSCVPTTPARAGGRNRGCRRWCQCDKDSDGESEGSQSLFFLRCLKDHGRRWIKGSIAEREEKPRYGGTHKLRGKQRNCLRPIRAMSAAAWSDPPGPPRRMAMEERFATHKARLQYPLREERAIHHQGGPCRPRIR